MYVRKNSIQNKASEILKGSAFGCGQEYSLIAMSGCYRVFIKYCVFSLKCCDFSELCQFWCSAGDLPAWCVYTLTPRENRERPEFEIFFKNSEKTQYLMNTL